ncbi:MAG: TrkH family potassium uptake protein [Candidatus Diapherotrites archaeon]|nr:TrkH family potassium uptake protein [Candidatus Diapherotrites archaeon]
MKLPWISELKLEDLLILLQIISNMLRVFGVLIIIPMLVALFYGETKFVIIFGLMALVLTGVFTVVRRLLKAETCEFRHALVSIAAVWIVIWIISAIPFVLHNISWVDALFESISGWSTTGLTMVPFPEQLPMSLNFWRAFTQWAGGFGVVVMALMFYENPKTAHELFLAEGRNEDFYVSVTKIARMIIGIYLIYTVLGTVLFLLTGMSFYDSVFHTFTSLATGGFSSVSQGPGVFGINALVVMCLLMLLGGIGFVSHKDLLSGKIKKFFTNPEVATYFLLTLGGFALIALDLIIFNKSLFFDGFFYAISAITTTGANTLTAVNALPSVSIVVLILLMIAGSCYGSTGGALKIWRILIVIKVVRRGILKALLPKGAIVPIKIGDKVLKREEALGALSYICLYIFFLLAGSIIFMFYGFPVIESVFTVASAQGNVGLSMVSGDAWYLMAPVLKILLSLHMLIGRMEIIPVLVLIRGFLSPISRI